MLATNCNFHNSNDEIRTRIIHGCYSEQLCTKALAESLDLNKLITTGGAIERARIQSSHMQETSFVNMVNEHKKPTGSHFQNSKTAAHSFKDNCSSNVKKGNDKEKVFKCNYCGKEHKPGKINCPASGKKCNKCKGNHFSSVCQTKVNVVRSIRMDGNDTTSSGINVDPVNGTGFASFGFNAQNGNENDTEYVFTVNSGVDELPTVYVSLGECRPILMHIDTCSTCNIIDEETFIM